MSKLPMKLQPPKNFKYKDLFGDKISKRDGASSSHIHDDVILPILFVMEHQCRNSLGLAIEAKACKRTGQERGLGDTSYSRECRRM